MLCALVRALKLRRLHAELVDLATEDGLRHSCFMILYNTSEQKANTTGHYKPQNRRLVSPALKDEALRRYLVRSISNPAASADRRSSPFLILGDPFLSRNSAYLVPRQEPAETNGHVVMEQFAQCDDRRRKSGSLVLAL